MPEEINADCVRWGRSPDVDGDGVAGAGEDDRDLKDLLPRGQAVPVYVMLPLDAIWLEEKVPSHRRPIAMPCRRGASE